MEYTHFQLNALQSNYHVAVLNKISLSSALSCSFPRLYPLGALKISVDVSDISNVGNSASSKVHIDPFWPQTLDKEIQIDCYSDSSTILSNKDLKERERRRKIGLANKGRVPWNKGIKRSAETRELIRQRTIEALRDPKVRKKMSEHPCPHSDQIKAKISSSLKMVWGERLKWKRLREKFFLSWAHSLAKSAKEGGNGQKELDWDSYDKINQEIALKQLQRAAEKANAKEMVKMRRERRRLAKEEKLARVAHKRKDREEKKAKEREQVKRKTHRKSREDKKELTVSQDLKLKQRLKKIHKRKSIKVQVTSQGSTEISHIPVWEKLNLELVKKEKMRIEVSLAEQIRAAKDKRAEYVAMEAVAVPTSIYSFREKSED